MYLDYEQQFQQITNENSKNDIKQIESLKKQFSQKLGKNLKQIITGGSSISTTVFNWMNEIFNCPVTNSYGCTEVPGNIN